MVFSANNNVYNYLLECNCVVAQCIIAIIQLVDHDIYDMYIYICMYVCMYVYMYECMYVCMHACIHACMYACMYVFMYVCI